MEVYGSKIPPLYDLSKINIPMIIAHGTNDALADPIDVNWLLKESTEHANILLATEHGK